MKSKPITIETILKLNELGLSIVNDPDAGFIIIG